ncbi:MAG: flagellar basal body rod flgC [Candidatus Midichloriaceae bacterium]|jgi:flagellar basal-body rod protein FlgC|nr:flagellar basal body rod flgC [Candidatus Midichloriaceae bacterium]
MLMLVLVSHIAFAGDDLSASSRISARGLQLQSERLKIIAQNIANADTPGRTANEAPYSRKVIVVNTKYNEELNAHLTEVSKISSDRSKYKLKYEPHHPAADQNGYVKYPNVDHVLEMADAKEAQRSYEANLSALEIARANKSKILEALK